MMKRKWSRLLSAFLALCLCMALMPAANAARTNEAGLPIEDITLTSVAQGRSSGYTVTYTAALAQGVGDTYAKIVAVKKEDPEKLKTLRFTCTLTDSLIAQMTDGTLTQDQFTFDGQNIFTFIGAKKSGNAITIEYKLNETAVNGWCTATAKAVHDAVMTAITMTANRTVTAAQLSSAQSGGAISSTAKIDLSVIGDGNIPGLEQKTATVAQGTANMTIIPYSSSGSGSSGDNKYPVNTDEETHGSVDANYDKAGEGTRVTITIKPDKGYRLGSLVVTDKNGNRIPITAQDDGTYTFIMPASEVDVEATFALVIASPEDTGVADWLNVKDHVAYMVGYDDGNFGPNDNVTRAQVAQMFYRLLKDQNVPITASFKDVPTDAWYATAVNTLASLGIVAGVGNGNYEPNRAITRAEFCAIAARFTKTLAESPVAFEDVPETYWAYQYIATAAAYGWVSGIGNDLFAPYDKITRAQAATIVNHMTGRLADQVAIDRGEGTRFPDVAQTYWAWYDIVEATTTHDYSKSDMTETWRQ